MPAAVRQTLYDFYGSISGNVHRGLYAGAEQVTTRYEGVRQQAASFIGAAQAREIIFTAGATDGINAIAHLWADRVLRPGDSIVVTQAEHHSQLVVWQEVAKRTGANLRMLPIDQTTWTVDLAQSRHLIDETVKLLAVTLDSNVLGPIWGVGDELLAELIEMVKPYGTCVALDAAQRVAHAPIDVRALDVDFLAFSAHKMGGPTGLGVLYAHERRHGQMQPYRFGGGMVHTVGFEQSTWLQPPHCFEAGTPPIAQVVAFGALLDFYAANVDWRQLRQHEAGLTVQLRNALEKIQGVHVLGNRAGQAAQGHLVSFYVEDMHAHDLAAALSAHGCAVRAGDHCAQPLSALWGKRATVRASFFMYTSSEDIEYFVQSLRIVLAEWRGEACE